LAPTEDFNALKDTGVSTALPGGRSLRHDRATLKADTGIIAVEAAGSFRRCKETVGDLDCARAKRPKAVAIACRPEDWRGAVAADQDDRPVKVVCNSTCVVLERPHMRLLQYFTGSKAQHLIRKLGQDRKPKINEYGLSRPQA
jgi:DNA polymerase (family 10)